MNAPTDEVDGERVYDSKSKTWIPFNSRSDALLANLILRHNFTLNQLNVVLKTIRDPGFDKAQITMNLPTDVLGAISLEGKRLANERSRSEDVWEQLKPGIPCVVFQLVVDLLKEEMTTFEEDVKFYAPLASNPTTPNPSHMVRQDLFNLTLVHRAWTPIARSALQRRAILSEPKQLVLFMRSVYCGPQVCELILEITVKFAERQVLLECPSLFAGLFACVPSLRSLVLKITGSKNVAPNDPLRLSGQLNNRMTTVGKLAAGSIKCLEQLEKLWIIAGPSPITYWVEICDSISSLNSLRFLCLAGTWDGQITGEDALNVWLHRSPPRSLKSVEFCPLGNGSIPKQVLLWFFLPSLSKTKFARVASPTIETLTIALGEGEACLLESESREEQQAISDMWASLQSLDCSRGSLNRVQQAVPLCTNLCRLTVGAELLWKLAEVCLPEHLEHLTLTCYGRHFIGVHDKTASSLFNRTSGAAKNSPGSVMRRLRRLDFLLHEGSMEGKELHKSGDTYGRLFYRLGREECMTQTSIACHSLGVKFLVAKFQDLTEAPLGGES